jgi:Na+-driven multidrug efflux pump
MRIVSDYGSQDVAAYTIALRIMVFILLPSGGIANAAATLMGQNLGAGKPERSEQAVWTTIIINIIFLGVVSLFFLVFPEFFVSLFISEADVVSVGADCLRIISAGFVFYGTSMVIIHAMNGAGDTTTPTKLNIVFFWLVELPLAFVLAKWAGLESLGVYWAILIAEAMFAVTSVLLFRRGKWKTAKV